MRRPKVVPIKPDTPPKPACFDSDRQWRAWLEAASSYQAQPGSDGYCADCTARYQGLMIRAGRCAYPTVTFVTHPGDNWGRDLDASTLPVTECDARRQGPVKQLVEIASAEIGFKATE
jgi:hypothetical protein